MSGKIDQFVENLNDKLNTVDDRINNFRASIDSASAETQADVQARLDKVKAKYEARKSEIEATRTRINASLEAKKLGKRVQRAEEYAAERIWLAMVAIDEAGYGLLGAMARIEAYRKC